ncbi:MAG TPA: LON peptidase substrate-binding domain-containing protein, partial [Arenicellales bacterium]|nr:LON peptidase substrate-binding domain-containing protein [Arenicellales bacterium]
QSRVAGNQLITAEVEYLEDEPASSVDEAFQPLVELLRKALPQAGPLYRDMVPRWDDPDWVAYRLAELLPDNELKQQVLRAASPRERLELVAGYLEQHTGTQ